jgi:leucyl-tRNA synthetase
MPKYNPAVIEPKWQRYWEQHGTFATPRLPEAGREKLYVLDMFPYPSGDGLHVGHPEGYTATDILARTARMQGKTVMHPMGFDAFGLPAEEHAIKTGTHPRVQTEENIETFRRQLRMLGFSYDWQRSLATTDRGYFRWTQWIFLQIYATWFDLEAGRGRPICELPIPPDVSAEGAAAVGRYQDRHRLAYQTEAPVNWCPALGTVLANEEVSGGVSERGGHPVVRKPLRQWMLRITAYADRLLSGLDEVDWADGIKALQRNWIGRSEGAEVDFFIAADRDRPDGRPAEDAYRTWRAARCELGLPQDAGDDVLRVYTTRPDTLLGATYMVVAPEHRYLDLLTTPDRREAVADYRQQAAAKSDLERTDLAKQKTGVFTGAYAINPVNDRPIPIWVADYVLISYGTGAIMAVPAHDERDFEFAQQFQLDIVAVVDPGAEVVASERTAIRAGRKVYVADGTAMRSGSFDALPTAEFKPAITQWLDTEGLGRAAVHYKLRDWLFSRQRFWGEPFPILHELDDAGQPTGRVRAVPPESLPIDLPDLDDYLPPGQPVPPLEKSPDEWLYPVIDGVRYKRETNTMPQWAGSCWYYLRFLDPGNDQALIDPEIEKAWLPVDVYIGGAEHAVLHLLYARFWHKVLYDRGVVSTPEPFRKLVNQGMILGEMELTGYQLESGQWVSSDEVTRGVDGGFATQGDDPLPVQSVRVAAADAEKEGDGFVLEKAPATRLTSRAYKMSKSRGNVVNPDAVVAEYGADSLRLYEMFMGPLEATKPWSMEGVGGVRGFLDRVWRLIVDPHAETPERHASVKEVTATGEQNRVLHRTIQQVTHDIAHLEFNTAIARMMEFTNFFTKQSCRPAEVMRQFVLLLAPFAPHISEELWQVLGHDETLAYQPWPDFDAAAIREETIEIVVQIRGKVRSKIVMPSDADQTQIERVALADERIAALLDGKEVVKVIVVPGRLVNIVTKGS